MAKNYRMKSFLIYLILIVAILLMIIVGTIDHGINFSLGIIGDADGPIVIFITLSPSIIYFICTPILILLFYYGWKKLKANN